MVSVTLVLRYFSVSDISIPFMNMVITLVIMMLQRCVAHHSSQYPRTTLSMYNITVALLLTELQPFL